MTALPLTSRFQIVERPVAYPGKCCVCGATDRACVDFNMDLEDYGAVYFCTDCMTEGGLAVGLILPSVLEEAQIEAGQSIDEYLSATNLKVISNDTHALLTALVDSVSNADFDRAVHSGSGDVESGPEADGLAGETAPVAESDGNGNSQPAGDASGQSNSTTRKRRSASVPADSGNVLGLDF